MGKFCETTLERVREGHGHYYRNPERPDLWKSQCMIDEEVESCEVCWEKYGKEMEMQDKQDDEIRDFASRNKMNVSICDDGISLEISCRYCDRDFRVSVDDISELKEYASVMDDGCTPRQLEDGEWEDLFPPCLDCKYSR